MGEIGSRKVFEDDRVIVWHLDLEPGERGKQHTHKLDYIARVIAGSTVEVFGANGESLYTVEREPGDAINFRIVGDHVRSDSSGSSLISATHSVRNIGTCTFKEVVIEFKK
jgi:hypothetical protein